MVPVGALIVIPAGISWVLTTFQTLFQVLLWVQITSFTLHNRTVSEVPLPSPFTDEETGRETRIQGPRASRTWILSWLQNQKVSLLFWFSWWTLDEGGAGVGQEVSHLTVSRFIRLFSCTHWQNFLFSLCILFWFTLHLLVTSGSGECDAEGGASCSGWGGRQSFNKQIFSDCSLCPRQCLGSPAVNKIDLSLLSRRFYCRVYICETG